MRDGRIFSASWSLSTVSGTVCRANRKAVCLAENYGSQVALLTVVDMNKKSAPLNKSVPAATSREN